MYVPAPLAPGAALVFVLHGSGQEGADIARTTGYAFDRLADRFGFVVVYPDGYQGNWNDCRKAASYPARSLKIDDESFLEAIIARLTQEHALNPHRVFVVGHSNGAQMAFRLGLERPETYAGIAAISAGLPTPDNMDCTPSGKPVATMIVNGTEDPLNPYNGGKVSLMGLGNRGTVLSTDASAAYFAGIDGQTDPPHIVRLPHQNPADPTWVEQSTWAMRGKAPVVLYAIHGGGHVVPQPYAHYPGLLGRQTEDLNAPAAIWTFFDGIVTAQ